MKKKTKILLIAILFICLVTSLLTVHFLNRQNNKKICPYFELDEVFLEINLVTNNSYLLSNYEMSLYIPISFSLENNYVFAYDLQNPGYFLLAKDLDEQSKAELEDYVSTNNKLYPENKMKFGKNEQYTYIILSDKYDSVIEGIIRSYIFC